MQVVREARSRRNPTYSNALLRTYRKRQHEVSTLANKMQVEGPLNNGVSRLHMVKYPNASEFTYKYLYLDVKGHDRIYLEREEDRIGKAKKQLSFFGIKW